ncbi:MAG: TlpA disulfide reductase family protein [Thiogranum sp.]|nr:TlpA disulfide reductase family protein [Thiogranum sp.]
MLSVNIGPFATSVDRLVIIIAVIVALATGAWLSRRRDTAVGGILINLVLIGMLAARISFVLRYINEYRDNWLDILDIRDGGFDPISGVLAAAAAAAWILWRRPVTRIPLAGALLAGGLTWAIAANLISFDTQARALPEATVQTLNGTPIDLQTLSETTGQPMVVNFWATWCPPCRREMPVLEAAQQEYPNITFVFVNQGEEPEQIQRFLDHESLIMDNILLDRGAALARETGARALPTTLFYDADGRLVDTHLGELSRATMARSVRRFGSVE